jgi:hypothetical protein
MLGPMGLMRPMGLIIKCFAFFANLGKLYGRKITSHGNSHRHFVPPRSLGKTSKEEDLIYSLEMNKLQKNASHFLELGTLGW